MLRNLAILLFFFSIVPIVAHGEFDNEFLRLAILFISLTFSLYAHLHWFLRVCGMFIHVFVVLILETPYLRELLLQVACFEVGKLN